MSDYTPLLIVYLVVREVVYTYQVNRLLNKLMSRNYHDYEFAKNVKTTMEHKGENVLKDDHGLPEDLSPVNGFGLN